MVRLLSDSWSQVDEEQQQPHALMVHSLESTQLKTSVDFVYFSA